MSEKKKFELEFLLHTSPKVLENMLFTPSGLSEWFADDVNINDDIYTFFWDGSEEDARLLTKRNGEKIKWQKIVDEKAGLDTYFQFQFEVDPMTKAVVLKVTDFEEDEGSNEGKELWESLIGELKRILGA
ncbi:MAG: START-like domain-containing protein [Crocinitomicaceae bacterium]